jgi:hypothetical protein
VWFLGQTSCVLMAIAIKHPCFLLLLLLLLRLLVGCRGLKVIQEKNVLGSHHLSKCLPGMDVWTEFNLTESEAVVAGGLSCHLFYSQRHQVSVNDHRGIPEGVKCENTEWCDDTWCTTVCKRGTVHVPSWLQHAHKFQHKLSASLPFCYSSWLGSHNSAITLADGYGNLDPVYESMFEYISWLAPPGSSSTLRTNDQFFSLTDQLLMGVRMIEIDTHWVKGRLRVAHCGGLHVEALNRIVEALNVVAKILGYNLRWDTETVGCDPSLSSIPAQYQRTFKDALQEIKSWMKDPENSEQFLIIYLDDEPDLETWGVVPIMIRDILDIFEIHEIFTPTDRLQYLQWPSVSEMLKQGFRVIFVSSTDFRQSMSSLIFPRGEQMCGWFEPGLRDMRIVPPKCYYQKQKDNKYFYQGSLIRTPSCEIQYGPLNCDFVWKSENKPILDESDLPEVLSCGLNAPSPDLLTPSRSEAAVWTWAPGYPLFNLSGCLSCTFISASDGRWRNGCCEEVKDLPIACKASTSLDNFYSSEWILNFTGKCSNSSIFDPPRHPKENFALKMELGKSMMPSAIINAEKFLPL